MARINILKKTEQSQLRPLARTKRRRINNMAIQKQLRQNSIAVKQLEESSKTISAEEAAAKIAEMKRRTAERFAGQYTDEDRRILAEITDSIERTMKDFKITPYEEVMARLTERQQKTTERFERETAGRAVEKHG